MEKCLRNLCLEFILMPLEEIIANPNGLEKTADELETIRKLLTAEIKQLLKTDFEKLMHILYRIDIDERQFREALQQPNQAEQIANLIVKRQIEKAISRKNN